MIYIGVDPGKSGAIAAINHEGDYYCCRMSETEHDVSLFLSDFTGRELYPTQSGSIVSGSMAIIERVHAMPKQGVSSTFKFGQSYGFLRGLLVAHGIPFEEVTPVKWQTAMGCRTKGDKNVTKAKAQQLFPDLKVTHATADALLIAEYCRRVHSALRKGQVDHF